MNICVATNVLVRAALPVDDGSEDASQSRQAATLLRQAETIIVTLPTLCEFAWVLRSVYRFENAEIATAIQALMAARNVRCDRRAASFGLQVAASGGDFADGVIAEAGFGAGADCFVSFDKQAVRLISGYGLPAQEPS